MVFVAWWLPFAALALVSAVVLHGAVGLTSWPLVEAAFSLTFLMSVIVLRISGRTLFESILVSSLSLVLVAALFALYAHHVSNNLN